MHRDNTDIKTDLNQAATDINAWKAKFQALDRSKNRQIEEIKIHYENNFKGQADRELKDLQGRFQNERQLFEM